MNVNKVREKCRMIRELSPGSTIVVGGHVTSIPGIEKIIDADHVVRGEGTGWMRRYLGDDDAAPIRHPAIVSGMRTRIMGIRLPERKGATAATIIPSVGCPTSEMNRLSGVYSWALWAMERQFRRVDLKVSPQIGALREEFKRESGVVSRMMPAVLGPLLLWTTRREEKRLVRGKTYEPPTFLERRNWVEA